MTVAVAINLRASAVAVSVEVVVAAPEVDILAGVAWNVLIRDVHRIIDQVERSRRYLS